MEAKDIVAKEIARQAEFGYEPSWENFVKAGQEAGIREVVEFTNGVIVGNRNSDWAVVEFPNRPWKEWQAKLKEWGILNEDGRGTNSTTS